MIKLASDSPERDCKSGSEFVASGGEDEDEDEYEDEGERENESSSSLLPSASSVPPSPTCSRVFLNFSLPSLPLFVCVMDP